MLPTWQSPLWQALTFFLYGLCVGSFTSVLISRLRQREQVVQGRSHCPHCRERLQARDLIPLFSYLLLRGRCRHCDAPISLTYPLLELGAALFAGAATITAGQWGGILALLLWSAGCWLIARRAPRSRSGFALTEAVLAVLLFALALSSALDVFALVHSSLQASERRTQAVLLARARLSQVQNQVTRADPDTWDPKRTCATFSNTLQKGDAVLVARPDLKKFEVTTTSTVPSAIPGVPPDSPEHPPTPEACQVEITVRCSTCKSRFGTALHPVTIRGLVRVALLDEEAYR